MCQAAAKFSVLAPMLHQGHLTGEGMAFSFGKQINYVGK